MKKDPLTERALCFPQERINYGFSLPFSLNSHIYTLWVNESLSLSVDFIEYLHLDKECEQLLPCNSTPRLKTASNPIDYHFNELTNNFLSPLQKQIIRNNNSEAFLSLLNIHFIPHSFQRPNPLIMSKWKKERAQLPPVYYKAAWEGRFPKPSSMPFRTQTKVPISFLCKAHKQMY